MRLAHHIRARDKCAEKWDFQAMATPVAGAKRLEVLLPVTSDDDFRGAVQAFAQGVFKELTVEALDRCVAEGARR